MSNLHMLEADNNLAVVLIHNINKLSVRQFQARKGFLRIVVKIRVIDHPNPWSIKNKKENSLV